AQRGRDATCQPVEIVVGPERLGSIGYSALRGGVQVDHVEVGRVGQRMPAKAAKSDHDQLTSREDAMYSLEFIDSCPGQRDQRTFGDAGVAFGDLERVAPPIDQLDSEREPPL